MGYFEVLYRSGRQEIIPVKGKAHGGKIIEATAITCSKLFAYCGTLKATGGER